jgi:hypothetical protein
MTDLTKNPVALDYPIFSVSDLRMLAEAGDRDALLELMDRANTLHPSKEAPPPARDPDIPVILFSTRRGVTAQERLRLDFRAPGVVPAAVAHLTLRDRATALAGAFLKALGWSQWGQLLFWVSAVLIGAVVGHFAHLKGW